MCLVKEDHAEIDHQFQRDCRHCRGDRAHCAFQPGKATSMTGLIGSEKPPFFVDVCVQKVLARHRPQMTVQTAVPREIAARSDRESFVGEMRNG